MVGRVRRSETVTAAAGYQQFNLLIQMGCPAGPFPLKILFDQLATDRIGDSDRKYCGQHKIEPFPAKPVKNETS